MNVKKTDLCPGPVETDSPDSSAKTTEKRPLQAGNLNRRRLGRKDLRDEPKERLRGRLVASWLKKKLAPFRPGARVRFSATDNLNLDLFVARTSSIGTAEHSRTGPEPAWHAHWCPFLESPGNLSGPISIFLNVFRLLHSDYRHGTLLMFSY